MEARGYELRPALPIANHQQIVVSVNWNRNLIRGQYSGRL